MTAAQLELFPIVTPDYAADLTIQEQFEAWIAVNEWVIPTVETLIRRLLDAGHKRVGIKQVWEVIRYEYGATTGDTFKANNNWTSRVSRVVLDRHPDWEPFIETRELRAA